MAHEDNPAYQALITRRSGNARALVAPGPDKNALAAIILAASRAPDHGRLVPFRFLSIAEGARDRLATLLEAASRALNPDLPTPEIERAREKAYQGPAIVAEAETSTLIGPGWNCRMDGLGYLELSQEIAR